PPLSLTDPLPSSTPRPPAGSRGIRRPGVPASAPEDRPEDQDGEQAARDDRRDEGARVQDRPEPRVAALQLDVADRCDHEPAAPAVPLLPLLPPGSAAEAEAGAGDGDDRDPVPLDRVAEDGPGIRGRGEPVGQPID